MAKKYTIDKIFKAFADPTRREIFHVLMVAASAMSLSQISEQFNISRQAVTRHINVLEDAGLLKTLEHGRERFCEANATPLNEIKNWLSVYDRFWSAKIRSLDNYLKNKK